MERVLHLHQLLSEVVKLSCCVQVSIHNIGDKLIIAIREILQMKKTGVFIVDFAQIFEPPLTFIEISEHLQMKNNIQLIK